MTYTVHYTRRPLAQRTTAARITGLAADEFCGYASLFNEVDGAGDVVSPGAFRKSLRTRPPSGVRLLYQHSAFEPIGVWQDIREDSKGLFVRGRLITETTRARDVMRLIRDNALNGLSIGFRTKRAVRDSVRHLRILQEIDLWEISVVTFPLSDKCQIFPISQGAPAPAQALHDTIRDTTRRMTHDIPLAP